MEQTTAGNKQIRPKLWKLTYSDHNAGVFLTNYADTIVFDSDGNTKILAAVRFGGYSEQVRGMADAIYGGGTVNVETETEKITFLSLTKQYRRILANDGLFIAINADNVNYIPILKIMRSMTLTPIFIITSNFNFQDQIEAYHYGADGYAPFQDHSEENIMSALALLENLTERSKTAKSPADYTACKNLFISPVFHQAFYKDKELELSKMEFDLLQLFMERQGHVLSHEEIHKLICGENENPVNINNAVRCLVGRLRRKLKPMPDLDNCIESVYKAGYKFTLS